MHCSWACHPKKVPCVLVLLFYLQSCVPLPFICPFFLYIIGFSITALSLTALLCSVMAGGVQEGLCAWQQGALLAAWRVLPLLVLSFPWSQAVLALMLFSAQSPIIQIWVYPGKCRLLFSVPNTPRCPHLSSMLSGRSQGMWGGEVVAGTGSVSNVQPCRCHVEGWRREGLFVLLWHGVSQMLCPWDPWGCRALRVAMLSHAVGLPKLLYLQGTCRQVCRPLVALAIFLQSRDVRSGIVICFFA